MVARGAGCGYISPKWEPGEQDAGDHKGPPSPTQPRSPLQILMTFSSVDAYWSTASVALRIERRPYNGNE